MFITRYHLSPKLNALRREIESGNSNALDNFWQEISQEGTPLIEQAENTNSHIWVTFLWRAQEDMRNVVVVGGLAGLDFYGNRMAHLPGTDIWYRTYRSRIDARFTYQLSPNDALIPSNEVADWEKRTATWQPDPLNPRIYTFPKGNYSATTYGID
ncbi:MAG: DUF3327 domain-containing protein [Chloroflexi bacterium]|nr:DUF3327 domain-containing protein [Chloroflexota bacterium]